MLIKYIQLDEMFDVALLKKEVELLNASHWKAHYNKNNYEGDWSTIQLRSINGSVDNNTAIQPGALQNGSVFKDTMLMELCPYIKQLTGQFKMEKTAVRLMKLNAGAVIKPHKDDALHFEEGEVRIHIPVTTSPEVYFFLEEERIVMEEGTCWYLNLSLEHSVRNNGKSDRVHLVIDGVVNDWLRELFNQPHKKKASLADDALTPGYSPEDKWKIIAQLRSMGTETGHKLADDMEASLSL